MEMLYLLPAKEKDRHGGPFLSYAFSTYHISSKLPVSLFFLTLLA